MKFLLIGYNEIDGLGQHVASLNTNLNNMGHKSKAIFLHKSKKENNNTIKIKRSLFHRIIFFILEFLKKDFSNLFSFGNTTIKYKSIKNYIEESDIIIIYSIHKIISLKMLTRIFKTGKIVYLRPLDMEFATGGCHVNMLKNGDECNKYILGCDNCPQLNLFNVFNISHKIFKIKKNIMEKYNPKIFVENTFTKNIYLKSPISKKSKIETIFLGTNSNRTNFISKHDARESLKIDKSEKIILFGTFNLDAPHKGGPILESILKILISNLIIEKKYKINLNKIKLITFGRKGTFNINIPEIEWIHLGLIDSDKKLNLLYRSADVLLSPSTGCNGPHIVVEALSNDLPVIAFNQGVAQDSVINGVNGYLIPCFDKNIFADAILKILFFNELNDKNNENNKLKSLFNSSYEAKTIIEHANNDLKK